MAREPSQCDLPPTGVPKPVLVVVGLLGAGVCALFAAMFSAGGRPLQSRGVPTGGPVTSLKEVRYSTPFVVPAISRPAIASPSEADLADSAEVIGVVVRGQPRAYVVSEFSSQYTHVVNDLVGDVPLTVTHCDKTECTRVLTSDQRDLPLNVELGGLLEGRLLLRLNDTQYSQTSDDLPLEDHPFVRTTWGAWKIEHPEGELARVRFDRRSRPAEVPASRPGHVP